MSNTDSILISVVMPTYNHARFIGKALKSVLAQNYKNLELIVVDNFSQDDTETVVLSHPDPRVKYVKFANQGIIAASRNHGISLSRGELVAFIDSDDIWLPDKLEKQAAGFASSEGLVMVYSRYKTIIEDRIGGVVFPKLSLCVSGEVFPVLYRKHFIACSGVMVRKSVLRKAGCFDENPALLAVEDMDLWLKIALLGDIDCASQEPLFLYRIHMANSSRGFWKKYRRAMSLLVKYRGQAGICGFLEAVALLSLSVLKQIFSEVE